MRSEVWVTVAAMAVAFSGCNCGPMSGTDGGTDGGGVTGGGTGGGATGGGTGGGGNTAAFTLALTPASIALAPGGTGTVTVAITRTAGFTGTVQLALENAPAGVAAIFTPNPADGTIASMGLTIPLTADAGVTTTSVKGTSGTSVATAALELTVTARADVLLIDDDGSENNDGTSPAAPSPSDLTFTALLNAASVPYAQFVVPTRMNGPTFDQVKDYKTLIWFTGAQYGGQGNVGTLSGTDELVVKAFLDQGDRKVIIFSNSYLYAIGGTDWTSTLNPFLKDYLGATGGAWDKLNGVSFIATGGPVMTGLTVSVGGDSPISTFTDPVNPAVGTDTLFTAMLDPDNSGVIAATIATGRKNVGTAGTSKALYFGFSFENVVDVGANNKGAVFSRLLAY